MVIKKKFRILILVNAVLTLSFMPAASQNQPMELNDILQSHYKATGLENKKNIQTLISFGALSQLGSDLQISIIQKRPSFYRMDVHLDQGRISQGFDGKNGWMLNPFVSADTVEIAGPELIQLSESADFDGILVNYKKHGYEINYESAGVWKGQAVYILSLKRQPSTTLRFFLNAETFLIMKTEADYMINELPLKAESEFSDYRVSGGVKFPYRIINRNGQLMTEIKIDTIRINEPLEDFLFR